MDSSQDHDNEQIPSLEGVQESSSSPDLPTAKTLERYLNESKGEEAWPGSSRSIYIPSISSFSGGGEPKGDNRLIGQEENEQEASGSQVQSHQPSHSAEAASSLGDDHVRFPSATIVSKLTTNRQPHHPYRKKTKV